MSLVRMLATATVLSFLAASSGNVTHAQRPGQQPLARRCQPCRSPLMAKRIHRVDISHGESSQSEEVPVVHLTLEEAKTMATDRSNVLTLAMLQVQEKRHAVQAARTDYFPKLIASGAYFRFDEDLGTVLTTRGRPVLGIPAQQVALPLVNQNAPYAALLVAQPITQLLQVRQAVNLAAADEQIAAAGYQKARREILKGVEQLYFGLLAAERIRGGAAMAVNAAEKYVALAQTPDARIALVQAQQAHFAVANQASSLAAHMNALLNLPLCNELKLSEPPPLVAAISCECEALDLALATNPDIYEARQDVNKAMAALNLAKSAFVPNVTLLGVGVAQDSTDLVQREFAGIGVQASHTLFEWGKKKHTLHQRQVTLALASRNLQQTRETVRLNTLKAYRKFRQDEQAVAYAGEMLKWRTAAQESTKSPALLKEAVQARMEAEVAYIQAQAQHRVSYAELMSITGEIGR